ncbi:MAG: electron transfer flavoprotein subunit beta/FixA family protein [Vampirovibrionales bacterium]|nr:electron transfer flavoprotein subunit beta/FixA family protein [Vampirovibrionales bacterium]
MPESLPVPLKIAVLIKQVPDTGAKAGVNPDGTIDRAKAKRMMNPFDKFALQAALHTKKTYGSASAPVTVTAISMGPPPATEILLEAIEHGADKGILLSDRRLAASDTLATSYALHKTLLYAGPFDLVFCGLQTTDGDTAQVGPQLAERLDLSQVTYCEDFRLEKSLAGEGIHLVARRVIEGGYQWLQASLPALVTVANSYHHLEYKSIQGARLAQRLMRDDALKAQYIETVTLDTVNADEKLSGLRGSPTIVGKTWKVGEVGGSCVVRQGMPVEAMVASVMNLKPVKELVAH